MQDYLKDVFGSVPVAWVVQGTMWDSKGNVSLTKHHTTNIPTDTNTHKHARRYGKQIFFSELLVKRRMNRLTNDYYYDIITIITTALLYTYIFTL